MNLGKRIFLQSYVDGVTTIILKIRGISPGTYKLLILLARLDSTLVVHYVRPSGVLVKLKPTEEG